MLCMKGFRIFFLGTYIGGSGTISSGFGAGAGDGLVLVGRGFEGPCPGGGGGVCII